MSYKVVHSDKHVSLLQAYSIIFGFSQACLNYPAKLQYRCEKEVRNEVRDLTALAILLYNVLYIQCSPTIDPFPLSIWNA